MNFKSLANRIGKLGLWERTLNSLSQEEILSLALAVDMANTEQDKTCGTCWYFGWKKLESWCLHQDHEAKVHGWAFSLGCKDYSHYADKPVGDYKPKHQKHMEAE